MLKNIFKRTREEEFIVIYISSNLTMSFENNSVIVQSIEKYQPTHWKLLNPDGYIIHFTLNDKNKSLSKSLCKEVTDLIINDDRFSEYKIGISEGPMIAEFNLKGKLISNPLGITENNAMQNLKGISELQT